MVLWKKTHGTIDKTMVLWKKHYGTIPITMELQCTKGKNMVDYLKLRNFDLLLKKYGNIPKHDTIPKTMEL